MTIFSSLFQNIQTEMLLYVHFKLLLDSMDPTERIDRSSQAAIHYVL